MRAERLGSYSMAATFAGIPSFSRRKSIDRYFRACPPPRCHDVTSPCALRPPVRFFDSTSDFSGVCLVMSLLSSIVRKRREGVYGLYVLSAIIDCLLLYLRESRFAPVYAALQILGVLDHLFAFRQPDVGFLPVAPVTFGAASAAKLAVKIRRAHVVHFHFENALDRFFDLSLRCVRRDFKHDGVLRLFHGQAFFRDDRPADYLIEPRRHRLTLLPFGLGLGLFLLRRRLLGGLWRSRFHWRFRLSLLARHFLFRSAGSGLDLHRGFRLRCRQRTAQFRSRLAREHQVVMTHQVVRFEPSRWNQRHAVDITAGAFEIQVRAIFHQQNRARFLVQLSERLTERLGLVRSELPAVHNRQFCFRELRGKRRTQGAQNHLLG